MIKKFLFLISLFICLSADFAISATVDSNELGTYISVNENSPIRYKIIDEDGKKVEVVRSPIPAGQNTPLPIEGALIIPKEIYTQNATYTVVSIGKGCFENEMLEVITLPETITKISDGAFCGCNRLYRIESENPAIENKDFVFNLPSSLEEIGIVAFRDCFMLQELSIPDKVRFIGNNAFERCSHLKKLALGKSVENILEGTFNACPLSNITLNEGLKSIGKFAFSQNMDIPYQGGLTELIIPDSVEKIGDLAFNNFTSLKNLVLGCSLDSIGGGAFGVCSNLETVTIRSTQPPVITISTFAGRPTFYVVPGTRSKYMSINPWRNYNILYPPILTDFVIEVDGEVIEDIFTNGLSMQAGEQKTIKATPIPYVEDVRLSWTNRYYGTSWCREIALPCEETTTITAKESGTDYVTISSEEYDFSKTFVLTVLPPPGIRPNKIELSYDTLCLKKGESVTITAKVLPDDAVNKEITWISSDDSVVCIDQIGNIKAVDVGEAKIIAICENITAICNISVEYAEPESFGHKNFGTIILHKFNNTIPATSVFCDVYPLGASQTVAATSSDENVAKVSVSRYDNKNICHIYATGLGSAIITLSAGKISESFKVTVVPGEVTDILMSGRVLMVGEQKCLPISFNPQGALVKNARYSSSEGSIASINQSGVVKALNTGETIITAILSNGVSSSCTISIVNEPQLKIYPTSKKFVPKNSSAENDLPSYYKYSTVGDIRSFTLELPNSEEEAIITIDDDNIVSVDFRDSVYWMHSKEVGTAKINIKYGSSSVTFDVFVSEIEKSVHIKETNNILLVGENMTLSTEVYPLDTSDDLISWLSCDNSIASVDENGKVYANSVGETTIVATINSQQSAICTVKVLPIPTSIELDKENIRLQASRTATLKAIILPKDTSYSELLHWTSSNDSVARVDADGTVTAVSIGEATITATCGSVSAVCVVTVVATPAENIILSQETATLKVHDSIVLTATVEPEDTTDPTIVWSSSNEDVAIVSENGVVSAVYIGTATIRAKCGEISATCDVTVKPVLASLVVLNKATIDLVIGENETLTATVEPANTTDATITWKSDNETVATVSADGVVTAISVGTATIIATCGEVSATCKVTVNPVTASSISLNVSEMTLLVEATDKLTATIEPANTTDATITWKSDNEDVVTVSADGVVTAISVGTATVTATCGEVSATCKVTVNPVTASSISLNVSEMSLLVGATDKLTATVEPTNTTDATITWKSDNEAVATVSADGVVVAISVGTATITATCGEVSATCKVTVKPIIASSITLNVSELTLLVGATDKLTATVEPENTTDATITWKSDNEVVATVSTDGLVTAVSAGTAIVKVSCGEVFAECKVTVTGYSGVSTLFGDENTKLEVYTLQGFKLKVENQNDLRSLAPGFYIINGKKMYLK